MILTALGILAGAVIGIPAIMYLFLAVHRTLDRLLVRHARKFCEKRGLTVSRFRWQIAFDPRRVKTEYTYVELDCLDAQKQRRLILVLASPLSVKKTVSDEPYPAAYDEKWPTSPAPRPPARPGPRARSS